ncbi:hypothetical protein VNO77_33443 [Canavalia gladiata]|uniref:TPX2 central domain-containing protein n=1 Tax=Canavalia gladiata TaxID=3824 RepID=A0AAN9Q0P6_CANGL
MEEEFEEIEVEYAPLSHDHEIDSDYEFDAPQFYDLTRHETFLDAVDAEQWFEFAAGYPPSPFLLKMRMRNSNAMKSGNVVAENCGPCMEPEEQVAIDDDDDDGRGMEYYNRTTQEQDNGKQKSLRKSSPSKDLSFMRPTASHLAKQKNTSEVQALQHFTRFQRQNSSSTDCQLTKRQKLEAGYLRKIARLKHQILFTHKKTKEGERGKDLKEEGEEGLREKERVDVSDINLASKTNVTIPKEPKLATAKRAQTHKCRTNAESHGPTQSSSQVFKARPLHKRILQGPSKLFPKIKTPKLTEFQEFHLRTSERAMQQTSNNGEGSLNSNSISNGERSNHKRTNSSLASREEKCRTTNNVQGSTEDKRLSSKGERGVFRNMKVFPWESNGKRSPNEPPSELFSKLSLASKDKQNIKSPSKKQPTSKGWKENRPRSLHQEHENMSLVKEGIQRPCGKQYQCVNEMGSLISKQACMLEFGH